MLMVNQCMSVEHLQIKAEVYGEEPAPLSLLPSRILRGLVLDQTGACAVRMWSSDQWHTQEFCSGGGVQQIQLMTEDRENGDRGW